MEFRWRVEGEEGVFAEKIDMDLWSEGLEKDGEETRLRGEGISGRGEACGGRGGKSSCDNKDGTEGVGGGLESRGKGARGKESKVQGREIGGILAGGARTGASWLTHSG